MQVLPLCEVQNRLSEVIDRVVQDDEPLQITRNGRPAAMVLSIADHQALHRALDSCSSITQ